MRQTKRFAVVGSDARQAAAGRALARAGYTVGGVQQLPQADCILLPLPLEQSGLPLAQLLGAAKPGALALVIEAGYGRRCMYPICLKHDEYDH